MKNLLFVTNESSHGGAERMLTWVANCLAESSEYCVYFCNLDKQQPFYSLSTKIKLIMFPETANEHLIYRNTIGFLKKTFFLLKIIKQEKIDLIINFNDHALYNIMFCKFFLKKIKVMVSQRVDPNAIVSKTGRFRLKLINFSDALVCQTKAALDFFPEKTRQNAVVIPNPIHNRPSQAWNIENTDDYIINVARIEIKQKRQDILLKAFAIVHKTYPNLVLKLYGSKINADYEKMIQLISELNLNEVVDYCGVSNNIIEEMLKAKLLVLSSDYEGIPNAVLEAMTLGMPIVSTDCRPDGARMLLSQGCGIITPVGDSELLAEAILKILQDPMYAAKMGKNALRSTTRFDEKKIAQQWYDYIYSILK